MGECFESMKTKEFWDLMGILSSATFFLVSPIIVLILYYKEIWWGLRVFNIFDTIFLTFLVFLAYWNWYRLQKNMNEVKRWLIKQWTGDD